MTQGCHAISIFTFTTECKTGSLTSHEQSNTRQGAKFCFEPFQQGNQAYGVHQHVEESQMNQGECVQPIHAAESDFFGDQCAPLYYAPDGLELENPKGNDCEENETGEER